MVERKKSPAETSYNAKMRVDAEARDRWRFNLHDPNRETEYTAVAANWTLPLVKLTVGSPETFEVSDQPLCDFFPKHVWTNVPRENMVFFDVVEDVPVHHLYSSVDAFLFSARKQYELNDMKKLMGDIEDGTIEWNSPRPMQPFRLLRCSSRITVKGRYNGSRRDADPVIGDNFSLSIVLVGVQRQSITFKEPGT